MGKNLNICMLLDFYGELLTEKQQDAVDFYYNQDFSLAEIAEDMSISRQGARDLIKRAEKQLLEFEDALGLVARFSKISKELKTIEASCKNIYDKSEDEQIKSEIKEISELIKHIVEKI